MFHYLNTLTNTRGDSLVGYFVRLRDFENPSQAVIPIYADESGTPIETVSGVVNQAKTDGTGLYDFWVEDGTYNVEILNPNGALVKALRGVPMSAGSGGAMPTDDEGIWNPNAEIIDNEGIWSV